MGGPRRDPIRAMVSVFEARIDRIVSLVVLSVASLIWLAMIATFLFVGTGTP
jgi:hypothetical protein